MRMRFVWDLGIAVRCFEKMAIPTRLISLLDRRLSVSRNFELKPTVALFWSTIDCAKITAELANEKTRHSQIAVALREMANQLRIKHGRVNYAIPGAIRSAF
jgi:hypothetical protein